MIAGDSLAVSERPGRRTSRATLAASLSARSRVAVYACCKLGERRSGIGSAPWEDPRGRPFFRQGTRLVFGGTLHFGMRPPARKCPSRSARNSSATARRRSCERGQIRTRTPLTVKSRLRPSPVPPNNRRFRSSTSRPRPAAARAWSSRRSSAFTAADSRSAAERFSRASFVLSRCTFTTTALTLARRRQAGRSAP
jgi:hypothetical protein